MKLEAHFDQLTGRVSVVVMQAQQASDEILLREITAIMSSGVNGDKLIVERDGKAFEWEVAFDE